jgi:hypothetical protein
VDWITNTLMNLYWGYQLTNKKRKRKSMLERKSIRGLSDRIVFPPSLCVIISFRSYGDMIVIMIVVLNYKYVTQSLAQCKVPYHSFLYGIRAVPP